MNLPGLMRAFDFPDPAASSPLREQTTIAPQALYFMNHTFVAQCARRLLKRPDVTRCSGVEKKIERIYQILFGRSPDNDEQSLALGFLDQSTTAEGGSPWSYGYAAVDEESKRVKGFTELTHWTGKRWQAGPKLPDPKLGWVFIDRNGGHPAATLDRCAVRRWTAPRDGSFQVEGILRHVPEQGDGVRARLVSSRHGIVGTWSVHHGDVETSIDPLTLKAGDTIDLVVDFQGTILHDEHEWPISIRDTAAQPDGDLTNAVWNSQSGFHGEASDPWLDYVHSLLMTNEFVFID